jgi:hypothetical protein
MTLGFRRNATRCTSLADLYCAFWMVFLRCCYHQILGPRRHLPKFANGRCRHSDAWVCLDPHLSRQATKGYMERGNAFGLVSHEAPRCSFRLLWTVFCAALAGATCQAVRELGPPPYSITSSAMARTPGGIVRPSDLATLRLISSSNFPDCTTGSSAGRAPLKILPL